MARGSPNCHNLLSDIPPPVRAPKTMNSEVRPCQTPTRKKVTKKQNTARNGSTAGDEKRRIRARRSGLYTYVLSQVDNVICQRFQNSRTEVAEKGRSKFSGRRTRIRRARAITISI